MQYSALIQNRKSYREFTEKEVPFSAMETLKNYYYNSVHRLIPDIKTQLCVFDTTARSALEGAAGYNLFLVGAPQYLVLLSEAHPQANAGFLMQDLLLKLADLELDSCWLTFTDGQEIKDVLGIDSPLQVAAIAAFGYGKKTLKRMQIMSSATGIFVSALPGRYYDAFGNYQGAFRIIALCGALSIPALWMVYRVRKPASEKY